MRVKVSMETHVAVTYVQGFTKETFPCFVKIWWLCFLLCLCMEVSYTWAILLEVVHGLWLVG